MKEIFLGSCVLIALLITCQDSLAANVKKDVEENREDNGDTNEDGNDETLAIPSDTTQGNSSALGPTCARKMNTRMHEIRQAQEKQFPFIAAIMSHEDEYLCCGAVVGNGLILTSAKCSLKPISYVLLNTTKAKKDDNSVSLQITKTEKMPTFSGTNEKNVALIYTERHNSSVASKILLSNNSDFSSYIDVEALGYGLNANVGDLKELQYIGVENHQQETSNQIFEGFFDCVETKVLTCYKDAGGPVIYENLLVGVVSNGTDSCAKEIYITYSINKKMIEYVPTLIFRNWLDEKIKKREESETRTVALASYPSDPKTIKKVPRSNAENKMKGSDIYIFLAIIQFSLTLFT